LNSSSETVRLIPPIYGRFPNAVREMEDQRVVICCQMVQTSDDEPQGAGW